jgi:Phage tail tube protein
VTYLSRLAKLGIVKETVPNTYQVPTTSLPFTKAQFEDVTDPLRDESIRTNDVVLQGLYGGQQNSTWDIETNLYPDLAGHFLRGMIGPDTVVAATSTTLSSASSIGATTISTAATIPATTVIQIDTSTNVEYAKVTAVSGAGPYSLTLASPLTITHSSGATVVTQTTHTFTQNRTASTVWPTYSITVDDLTDVRGFPGCVMSELQVKIDPKGIVTFNPKYSGFPSSPVSTFSPAYTNIQPLLGWQWTMTNAGAASTRGLTFDTTWKRAVEIIGSSDGTQAPREIFPGAMEADGSYKAIYENNTDLNLFMNYTQTATTATLTQPVSAVVPGMSLAVTMSKSGYSKGSVDLGQTYVQADFDISGINNTTDNGIATVVLKNFTSATY